MQKSIYEFISKTNNDPIVERRTCKISGKEFAIFQSDLNFYNKISPTFDGKKYPIPLPTLCPEERQRRRMVRRNERKLYRRKCDATGKQIISMYSPDKPYKVYSQDARFSDSWDAKEYGLKINFSKSMREQFSQLLLAVPKRGLSMGRGSENCDYANGVGMSKNCYLIFGASFDEECYYGSSINNCKNCVDNTGIKESENLYGCVDCTNCYKCFFSNNCLNCKDSSYLRNCKNCDRCFGCVNLENQQYHIFNKPFHDKETYEKEIFKITKEVRETEMQKLSKDNAVKNVTLVNVEGGIGDVIFNSKNIFYGLDVKNSENIKYGTGVNNSRDCMDVTGVDGYLTDGCLKIFDSGYIFEQSSEVAFSTICRNNCHNIYYCIECCRNVENCFLCNGLQGGAYCILNKQYTPEEYNKLVPKIIEKMKADGERGENFPISMSTFAYNETVAQERLPLTREEAIVRGYKRQDNNYDPVISSGITTLTGDQIPSDITSITDDILNAILICEVSKRPFRIIKQELDFYRKYHLPLPRKHPDIRHLERLAQRPGRELHLRTCDNCGVEMLSVYPQDSELKVFCETCYNKEVYG